MAASIRFWWFIEHVRDGITRTFGSLASAASNLASSGNVFKPLEALSIPAGKRAVLWAYEATNQGNTDSLNEFGEAVVTVDEASEGGVYLYALVCKKDATTNLPTSLATNGVWQALGWIPCGGVYKLASMLSHWTPNDGTAQDGDFPAIGDDADAEEARVYRLAVYNPGTEAVVVNTLIG